MNTFFSALVFAAPESDGFVEPETEIAEAADVTEPGRAGPDGDKATPELQQPRRLLGCHWEGPLIGGGFVCPDGSAEPGIDYSTIRIQNKCNRKIQVAVHYLPTSCWDLPSSGDETCLGSYVPPQDRWVSAGWWHLDPGETNYIADTLNRHVYFYAETIPDGEMHWAGDLNFEVRGRDVRGFHTNMGPKVVNFTQVFTCN